MNECIYFTFNVSLLYSCVHFTILEASLPLSVWLLAVCASVLLRWVTSGRDSDVRDKTKGRTRCCFLDRRADNECDDVSLGKLSCHVISCATHTQWEWNTPLPSSLSLSSCFLLSLMAHAFIMPLCALQAGSRCWNGANVTIISEIL